jgi:hypothetical protein
MPASLLERTHGRYLISTDRDRLEDVVGPAGKEHIFRRPSVLPQVQLDW